MSAGDRLADLLAEWVKLSGLPGSLEACGIAATVSRSWREAEQEWTAKFNPRPAAARCSEQLYHAAYNATV
ncbi:MAG: hypothetical protein U1D30_14050 [Planctomycetota bacterium]